MLLAALTSQSKIEITEIIPSRDHTERILEECGADITRKKNKIISIIRLLFYFANIILAVLYLFPGSILGWILYDNMYKQPQITSDIIVSTNHVYAFILLTILGVFSFNHY